MKKKAIFLLFSSLIFFQLCFAQSGFPTDSVQEFDRIKLLAMSIGKTAEGTAKFKEAESVLERTFVADKKLTLTIRYSTLYNVMDDSGQNFYVTFMENGKLIILWFHRQSKDIVMDPDFISAADLISQIEKYEEGDLLELEIEIKPGGAGNINAYVPKRTTYAYKEDSKFFLHAKLLAVKKK